MHNIVMLSNKISSSKTKSKSYLYK